MEFVFIGVAIAAMICVALLVILLLGVQFFPRKAFHLFKKTGLVLCGLREQSLDVEGLHISYLEGGQGEPLVLLHGFAGGKEHWSFLAKYLGKHFQIVAPDLPGFGSSCGDRSLDYSIEEQVKRVFLFSQALGLARFHLVGNSMGGNIAGVFAARYPETLLSLCLIDPAGVVSACPSEREILQEQGVNILVARNFEDFRRTYRFCFAHPPFVPGFVLRILYEEAEAKAGLYEKMCLEMVSHPVSLESIAEDITVPTLVLWGDKDRSTHVSGAQVLQTHIPHVEIKILNNIGHMPMIERPGETARCYLEFQRKG